MVQAARVQEIVKGDDVVLRHQIIGDQALNAEVSRVPIQVQVGDTVSFFYPTQDQSIQDLIGYPGNPVGSLPASLFDVPCPGVITPILQNDIKRGTSIWQSGLGRTVRAEISRQKAVLTANTASGSPTLSTVSSFSGVAIGEQVSGPGIPSGALVESFDTVALTVTLTQNASATATGVNLRFAQKETHYAIDEVDVFERGFPTSLTDTSGGINPPAPELDLP